jgi:hypothetical protein
LKPNLVIIFRRTGFRLRYDELSVEGNARTLSTGVVRTSIPSIADVRAVHDKELLM